MRLVRTVSTTIIVLVYNCTSIGHGSMGFAAYGCWVFFRSVFIHADALVFIDSSLFFSFMLGAWCVLCYARVLSLDCMYECYVDTAGYGRLEQHSMQ